MTKILKVVEGCTVREHDLIIENGKNNLLKMYDIFASDFVNVPIDKATYTLMVNDADETQINYKHDGGDALRIIRDTKSKTLFDAQRFKLIPYTNGMYSGGVVGDVYEFKAQYNKKRIKSAWSQIFEIICI